MPMKSNILVRYRIQREYSLIEYQLNISKSKEIRIDMFIETKSVNNKLKKILLTLSMR